MRRNYGIDLLRCILMMLIVLHHSAFHGYYEGREVHWLVPTLFTTLVMWHVDAFAGISGWFGINFSWRKFLNLWGQCLFYTGLSIAYVLCFERSSFSYSDLYVKAGWYGGAYFMLMFTAPIVNAAINSLYDDSPQKLIYAWLVFAGGMALSWLPGYIVKVPGGGPFSYIALLFMYVTVRVMRVMKDRIPKHLFVMAVGFYVVMIGILGGGTVLTQLFLGHRIDASMWCRYTSYISPHVCALAAAIVYVFAEHIHVGEKLGRVCVYLGPSMFGVYLMHETTKFGKMLYRVPEEWLATRTEIPDIFVVLICGMGTFVVCICVDLIRRLVVGIFEKFVPEYAQRSEKK